MSIDTAVVLAGGEGRRLRPLTRHRPKPMLPAANRPILEYVFDAVIDAGIDNLHVVIGYERDRVRDHFGSTYRDRPVTYHVQEKQLGSGHALFQARTAIETDFIVVNGDEVITNACVADVLAAHSTGAMATLSVVESTEAPMYGAVELEDGVVTNLIEKPRADHYRLLNAGVYAFGPSIFSEIDATPRERGELGLPNVVARVIDRGGHVRGTRCGGVRSEVTYPWDLTALTATVLTNDLIDIPARDRDSQRYVAESATVADTATLHPPVVVSDDAVIEPNAVVGPHTAVGQNTTVESGAVVRRTVLDTDTRIGANATIVDSVIGRGVTVDVDTTMPGGPADVRIGERIHEDKQLGCVVADRTRLGGGTTITPGVLIGPNARIEDGVVLTRNVPEGAEVRH